MEFLLEALIYKLGYDPQQVKKEYEDKLRSLVEFPKYPVFGDIFIDKNIKWVWNGNNWMYI